MKKLKAPKIFESKRFITLIVGLLFELVVLWIPGIEPYRAEMLEIGLIAMGAVIASFTGQDWIAAARGTATKYFDPKAPYA